jgi:hypothetical protein
MIVATRILNLVSGVFAMATGIYMALFGGPAFSDQVRFGLAAVATVYFLLQVYRQLLRRAVVIESSVDAGSASQFSS